MTIEKEGEEVIPYMLEGKQCESQQILSTSPCFFKWAVS